MSQEEGALPPKRNGEIGAVDYSQNSAKRDEPRATRAAICDWN
jgi:hypothetical protein